MYHLCNICGDPLDDQREVDKYAQKFGYKCHMRCRAEKIRENEDPLVVLKILDNAIKR